MEIFKRHFQSSAVIAAYLLWWLFVVVFVLSRHNHIQPLCDFSVPFIVLISVLLGFTCALLFTVKALMVNEPDKTDYLIFLGLTTLPLLTGGAYVMSNL